MNTKTCNKCELEKSLESFAIDNSRKDGRQYTCKECRNNQPRTRLTRSEKLPTGTQRCSSCKEVKLHTAFPFKGKDHSKRKSECKECTNTRMREWRSTAKFPTEEKFWSYVNHGRPNECWEWIRSHHMITISGQSIPVHRMAYQLSFGEIGDHAVTRTCGNDKCCNPSHLELGKILRMPTGERKDWSGQKFNMLTLARPTDKRSGHAIVWEADCECGNTTYVVPNKVAKGTTQSCGCLSKQTQTENGYRSAALARKFEPMISTARIVWGGYKKKDADCVDFEIFYDLSQKPCHYCDRLPHRTVNKSTSQPVSDFQIEEGDFTYNGIDRIDSSKNHTEDNIVSCCWDCNRAKGDMSYDEFIDHIERMWTKSHKLKS